MEKKLNTKHVLQHFKKTYEDGSVKENLKYAADCIGVTTTAFYSWVNAGRIPDDQQLRIQGITECRLRADPYCIPPMSIWHYKQQTET